MDHPTPFPGAFPHGNIFLVGLMGAGKTSVGKLLAKRLSMTFLDSDHEIEARTGVKIPVIFEIEGEAGFRAREAAVIDELDWTVSLLVDGQPTEIRGLLKVESPPSVLPWVLLIAALSGLAVLTGRRNPAVAAVVLAATAAVVSVVLAAVVTISTPVQLGRDLFPVLLTIGASLTCAGAVILRGRSRMILTVASAALSAGFLATMVRNLATAVPMPAVGPPVVNRIAVSLALASMLATIVLAVIASGRPSTATRPSAPPQPTAP
jgi:hypothetical protein